jgi:hypothetical protein
MSGQTTLNTGSNMPKLKYVTAVEIPGPWLLDEVALFALDDVVDEQYSELCKAIDERLDAQIKALMETEPTYSNESEDEKRERIRRYESVGHHRAKSLTVYLKDGRSLDANSFRDAVRHPGGAEFTPVGFSYRLRVDDIRATIKLSSSYRTTLDINVDPEGDQEAEELYGKLSNWSASFQPPIWQQKWLDSQLLITMFVVFIPVCFFFVWGALSGDVSKSQLRHQAHELIQNGVNASNQPQATQLVLALLSEYSPPNSKPFYKPGSTFWLSFILSWGVAFALTFCPKVVLGIAGGKRIIGRWRFWVNWLWVTLPGAVASLILIPKLLDLLK